METITRYVATRINQDGMRTLVGAMQGRNTFETDEQAQHWIDAVVANNTPEQLVNIWHCDPKLEVRPVACYPHHFDPLTCWFD